MRKRLIALAAVALLASCKSAGPEWLVVAQARENPMSPTTVFHLESVTFEGARIDDSPIDALATLPASERSEWQYNLGELQKTYSGAFLGHRGGLQVSTAAVGAQDLIVRARVERITTAKRTSDDSGETTAVAHLQIANASGAVLDEILIEKVIRAAEASGDNELRARRPERMRKVGAAIGDIAAAYIRERSGVR